MLLKGQRLNRNCMVSVQLVKTHAVELSRDSQAQVRACKKKKEQFIVLTRCVLVPQKSGQQKPKRREERAAVILWYTREWTLTDDIHLTENWGEAYRQMSTVWWHTGSLCCCLPNVLWGCRAHTHQTQKIGHPLKLDRLLRSGCFLLTSDDNLWCIRCVRQASWHLWPAWKFPDNGILAEWTLMASLVHICNSHHGKMT